MYSAWATKRRSVIIFVFTVIFSVASIGYMVIKLYAPPSCYDRKMNQDELGIDCGGVCDLMCAKQIEPLNTVWARSFEVSSGMWSAFAYVENPNPSAWVPEASYRFSLFDRNGSLITTVEDSTFLSHKPIIPIFKGRIELGDRIPYTTEFEWLGYQDWYRIGAIYEVVIEEQQLMNIHTKPEIQAVLANKEPLPLVDVEVTAIVYDDRGNAIAVSKTYVDRISARGKRNITFTWPNPFVEQAKRLEIIPRIPPQEE